jgi:hypothetical protein
MVDENSIEDKREYRIKCILALVSGVVIQMFGFLGMALIIDPLALLIGILSAFLWAINKVFVIPKLKNDVLIYFMIACFGGLIITALISIAIYGVQPIPPEMQNK